MIVRRPRQKPLFIKNPAATDPRTCSRAQWCLAMERALEPEANTGKKGFSVVVIENRLKRPTVAGVVYKKAPADRGQMLTLCPWCGCRIAWEDKIKMMETA